MMTITRRQALSAAALLAASFAVPVSAQSFPSKPIRIVVAFAPGGPTDLLARGVADKLSASFKQPVVVENKPGAAGNLAAAEVAKADPDGHTVFMGIDTTFTINPAIYPSMPFAENALKPLMVIGSSSSLLAVHADLKVKSLQEFVAKAKAQRLTFSSAGNGSPGHLATELFSDAIGAEVTHVPYRGSAPAVMALLSGEVQAGILTTPGLVSHVRSGKVTALAVTSRQRSAVLPDVPTTAEAGLGTLLFEALQVAMVPAAMPAPVVEIWRKALGEALDDPALRSKLAQIDLIVEKQTGPAVDERLASTRTRYARIVKATGMKAE